MASLKDIENTIRLVKGFLREGVLNMQDLIKRLAELYGPAGSEERVAVYIQESIRPVVHEVYTDPMGSVVAVKRGRLTEKKIMLAAHMDEIGVMVTDIDEKGFLRFSNIGGISPFTLIAQRAEFRRRHHRSVWV